jgi:hypothetical protein
MRLPTLLLIAGLTSPAAALEPPVVAPIELNMALVQRLERHIQMPAGARALARYDRYYALEREDGHIVVRGLLLQRDDRQPDGAATILPRSQWLMVSDGGCGVVELVWDAEAKQLPALTCNGVA